MDSDENTPLLSSNAPFGPAAQFPSIHVASRHVAALDVNQIRFEDIVNDFVFEDHPTQVSFALAVLLHLRKKKKEIHPSDDLYGLWLAHKANLRDVDTLENLLTDIWTLFLAEYRSVRDIQTALWTSFLVQDDGENGNMDTRRVVDFLAEPDSPDSLLSHPLISAVIERVWIHGTKNEDPRIAGLLTRYDALSTPRAIHFIDWLAHITFLVFLFHYLLYPIEQPHTSGGWSWYEYGPREVSLVLLALSFGIHSRSFVNISALLVPISFLTSLPSAPHPESFSFIFLQWAAFLQPLGLNFPHPPSHLFLFQHRRSLPLAVLINRALSRILYPVSLFFFPLLLLATYLLSLSLADAFLRNSFQDVMPPPLETRFTFLCFFVTVLVLLLASISVLAISTSPAHNSVDLWDRYSTDVGRSARKINANVVSSYSTSYIFPPPFNLIHIVVVWIPRKVATLSGYHYPILDILERVVWRIFVGPLTAFVAFLLWRPRWLSRTASL
ncbi:hypothetical protein H2248_000662 [Termitomyces sp. 'cryptogamus']|nr:hypothetical protein H2248_000662 [Termitomyces sp. 'cryptogamus']